jgi:hypothetical protein
VAIDDAVAIVAPRSVLMAPEAPIFLPMPSPVCHQPPRPDEGAPYRNFAAIAVADGASSSVARRRWRRMDLRPRDAEAGGVPLARDRRCRLRRGSRDLASLRVVGAPGMMMRRERLRRHTGARGATSAHQACDHSPRCPSAASAAVRAPATTRARCRGSRSRRPDAPVMSRTTAWSP